MAAAGVQGSEFVGGSAAMVVLRLALCDPAAHRDQRRGVAQGLDVRFVIDSDTQRGLWWVDVQPQMSLTISSS